MKVRTKIGFIPSPAARAVAIPIPSGEGQNEVVVARPSKVVAGVAIPIPSGEGQNSNMSNQYLCDLNRRNTYTFW